jgi:hypothetical protein
MTASEKQYLVIDEKGNVHLPVRETPEGPLNHRLMGAAWAALHGGYRGKKYDGPGKAQAIEKLKSRYRSEGMELPTLSRDQGIGRLGEIGTTEPDEGSVAYPTKRSLDLPVFFALLADVPRDGLMRIPIAITGGWKGAEKEFSIGLDDLEEIRANFASKPTGEINVDYEHASEVPFGTGGPVLSAGRIVKLDQPELFEQGPGRRAKQADGQIGSGQLAACPSAHLPTLRPARFILWGWYEPTERARTLIQAREYRYISPAIRWGAKDKMTGKAQGTTLTSVALVNKPFLEEMPAIGAGAQPAEGQVGRLTDGYSAICPPALIETGAPAFFAETVGKQKVFVSLGQVHVPGPVNQDRDPGRGTRVPSPEISVAYGQPEKDAGSGNQDSGPESRVLNPESSFRKENGMATKSLNLRCLTAADVAKYGLPDSHLGKIGVFDDDEPVGTANWPQGWTGIPSGEGDTKACDVRSSEVAGTLVGVAAPDFASEIGLPGKSLAEIAALAKLGMDAAQSPSSTFELLSECIHDGQLNLREAGALADAGKVKFSTILAAEDAGRKVDAAVKTGKVLPRNRAHALRVALSDTAAFGALVEQAQPVVDLRTRGHAGGGEQPTAQQALMAEVNGYAQEHKCSVSVALSEITKAKPELWREYSAEIVTAVAAETDEEE